MTDPRKQADLNKEPEGEKTYSSYQEFYDDIPIEGSLGILALGAAGVIPWRIKREKAGVKPDFIVVEQKKDEEEQQEDQDEQV